MSLGLKCNLSLSFGEISVIRPNESFNSYELRLLHDKTITMFLAFENSK